MHRLTADKADLLKNDCSTDVSENYYDSDKNGELDGSALCVSTTCYSDMDIQSTAYSYPGPDNLMNATDAVTWVLDNVGTNYPARDSVDALLVSEVQTWGSDGELISDETASPVNGPGYIAGGTALTDTDGDGIPDSWEQANGLDYQDASDAMDISTSGYANIEVYLNSLVPSTNGL